MPRARVWVTTSAASLVACIVACAAPGKGSLILAISTDMQAPKDVDIVSVYIETDSQPKFDYLGRVTPEGTVSLPSTLAIVEPDNPGAQIRVRVIAFQQQKARVLRDVVTTVPHQRTALLRMPLDFLDDGSVSGTLPQQFVPIGPGAPGGPPEGSTQFQPADSDPTASDYMKTRCDFTQSLTSVQGTCVGAAVDSSSLPDYSDELVYGPGGTAGDPRCFAVQMCFASGAQVMSVAMGGSGGTCSFPLPAGASATTLNVAIATSGAGATGTPIGAEALVPLDSDATGGAFSVQGNAVTLVPGVCAKLATAGTRLITSTQCAPKVAASPVCPLMMSTDSGAPADDAGGGGHDGSTAAPDAGLDASPPDSGFTCGIKCSIDQDCAQSCPPPVGSTASCCNASTSTCYASTQQCPAPVDSGVDAAGDGGAIQDGGSCVPRTCASLGYDCGPAGDGCGGLIASCGTCPSPQYCGGGGPYVCGGNSPPDAASPCQPMTCAQQGIQCGLAGDGCGGGPLDCGSCTAPQTCGGKGTPGVCG